MMYYDGQFYSTYGGLFSPMTFEPLKAYYAMKAYGMLYADGTGRAEARVTEGDKEALKVFATKKHVLLVNRTPDPLYITLDLPGASELWVLDSGHDLSPVNFDGSHIPLEGFAVAVAEVD